MLPGSQGRTASLKRAVVIVAATLALAGCSGDGAFSLFGPKEPDVPQVPTGQFPNVSVAAPDVPRPPVLDAAGQAKMQSDLETLGKTTQQKGEDAAKDVP